MALLNLYRAQCWPINHKNYAHPIIDRQKPRCRNDIFTVSFLNGKHYILVSWPWIIWIALYCFAMIIIRSSGFIVDIGTWTHGRWQHSI